MSRSVAAAGFVLLAALTAPAQPAARPVKEVSLDPQSFDDTAEVLKIVKRSGRVKLAADAPRGRLAVEFYVAGKKDAVTPSIGYGTQGKGEEVRMTRFAVQFADLDYLPLGTGPKGHHRMLLKVGTGELIASITTDVPKDVFDASNGSGGGVFDADAATATEIPLFWMVARTNTVSSARTPREIVEKHSGAQVAIFTLRLGEKK
ncbi:hypothetical protein J0H58_12535 [bacterium]|nr:hypothetical protein [bacterium]